MGHVSARTTDPDPPAIFFPLVLVLAARAAHPRAVENARLEPAPAPARARAPVATAATEAGNIWLAAAGLTSVGSGVVAPRLGLGCCLVRALGF